MAYAAVNVIMGLTVDDSLLGVEYLVGCPIAGMLIGLLMYEYPRHERSRK